jgi:hypothetical protein
MPGDMPVVSKSMTAMVSTHSVSVKEVHHYRSHPASFEQGKINPLSAKTPQEFRT